MTPASLLKFLNAARSLAKQGFKQEDIIKFAKQEFGEVTDLVRLQINKIFKTKNQPSVGIKTKDTVFDNTVQKLPMDDTGAPFNPRDPQKVYGKPKANPNRILDEDEIAELDMDIGGLEYTNDFDGTLASANKLRKERADYVADMELEYKKGNLDPVAGDTSPARKRFLEKKLEDMEMSGDTKLMDPDEVEELSTFDLGTDIDSAKLSVNDEIKKGVADVMSDTSPAALKKSIEVDDLMLKYPGMSRELAKQIANDPDPARKAQVISMVEQTIKMGDEGMSGDEIIDIFKKGTDRTKQAKGGRIKMAKGGLPNILGF
jgi:hypothetical protein